MGLDTEQKPLAQKGKKYRLNCINAQSIIKENGGEQLFIYFFLFLFSSKTKWVEETKRMK